MFWRLTEASIGAPSALFTKVFERHHTGMNFHLNNKKKAFLTTNTKVT